jgi:hypothetical protein
MLLNIIFTFILSTCYIIFIPSELLLVVVVCGGSDGSGDGGGGRGDGGRGGRGDGGRGGSGGGGGDGSGGGGDGGGSCKNMNIIIQTTKQLNVNTLTLNKDPQVHVQ